MPHSNIEHAARKRARTLRSKLTKAERDMWDMLRARFRRETPIGPYIADFAWLSARLIIEVDGDTHETLAGRDHDSRRDAFLKAQGFVVLRFDNVQAIEGSDHVFTEIERHLRHLLKDYPEV